MKTVILCGGKGTRMSALTEKIPKPLVAIGEKPVLWHIMKIYASQGFDSFVLCLGYKGSEIKKYFEKNNSEKWKIEFADTGENSTKSQRLEKVKKLISDENFFLAYGDDLSNVDLKKLKKFHEKNKKIVTVTAVKMESPFGILETNAKNEIIKFYEKPILDYWLNGGYMVLNKKIFNYLKFGELEKEVFEKLVREKEIQAFKHSGEWKTMNTLKDNQELNELWENGKAFWKIW
ncbi:MAG: NTP transferase domain-containing protein [Candidatus Diapherotrites archaeon]|nr:NTP transferase domain-containing protein [Candidatus Diapherotrites archaeon]